MPGPGHRLTICLIVCGGMAASVGEVFGQRPAGEESNRPNVLFIAIDDLNDWIGCLGGYPGVRTPNFDRLAERGVLFTGAHCNAPLCNASRASLMTGMRPSTSGVYTNSQSWRASPVLSDAVTLSQYFRAHGYRAIGGGKIYHGSFPDPPSWDDYYPSQQRNRPPDPLPANRPLNGIPRTQHFDWGPVEAPVDEMGDTKVVDWAVGELGQSHDQPQFLAVGIFRPHLPWYVPPQYFDAYPLADIALPEVPADDLEDIPQIGRRMARPGGDHRRVLQHDQWHEAVRGYLASITFADDLLGRLLDALDRSPMRDNTIIVLWSDHGWHLGEKHHWRKFTLWEESTRVPLMIVAPGVTQAGTRCEEPVSLLDLYPTLVELAGLPAKEGVEGTSLVPQARDPSAPRRQPVVATHGFRNHAIRDGRYRYIRYADGSEELYDHRTDPQEWENVAAREDLAEVKQRLASALPEMNRRGIGRGQGGEQ
ncbi:MAG: sulfatase [Pirellulales bacterium]